MRLTPGIGTGLVGKCHMVRECMSPSMEVMIGEEKYMEWLVASSSRDRTGRLWSSMKCRTVHIMRLPQDNRRKRQNGWHCWVSVV
jgi:hypothetical protein